LGWGSVLGCPGLVVHSFVLEFQAHTKGQDIIATFRIRKEVIKANLVVQVSS
jgi:hypothetical protein